MRILAVLAAVFLAGAGTGAAHGEQQLDWLGVGRLSIAGQNMCTGALIAPDLVVTAAHCLYDRNGIRQQPGAVHFQAGVVGNRAAAERGVQAVVIHPEYRFHTGGTAQLGFDLALLRLDRPISAQAARPFRVVSDGGAGASLGVVSYSRRNRSDPALKQPCAILGRKHDTMVLSCTIEFGASGAPVFAFRQGQRPQLVSVISAKADMGNREVSISTALDGQLRLLLNMAG